MTFEEFDRLLSTNGSLGTQMQPIRILVDAISLETAREVSNMFHGTAITKNEYPNYYSVVFEGQAAEMIANKFPDNPIIQLRLIKSVMEP